MQSIIRIFFALCFLLWTGAAHAQFTANWATQGLGSSRTDEGKAITRDANGNVYVSGYFRELVIIGNDTLRSTGNNRRDPFVAKYTAAGTPVWAKAFPGTVSQDDRARGITVDASGNIYFTGEMRGKLQVGSFLLDHADGTNRNGFVVKLDTDGNVLWANMIQSIGGDDRAYGVTVGPDGGIYVAGQCGNNTEFATGATPVVTAGGVDAFIAKYDASGAFLWAQTGGSSSGDRLFEILFDVDGNAWSVGFAGIGTTITFGGTVLTSLGEEDMILVKYAPDGTLLSAINFGGAGSDEAGSLTFGPNNLLYVGGSFSSSVSVNGQNFTSAGSRDAIVIAFAPNTGLPVAAAAFGGPGLENVYAVRGTEADLFVGGLYGLNTAGAPGQGITLLGVDYPASAGGDGGAFLTQFEGTFAMKAAWAVNNPGGLPADSDTEDVQSISIDTDNELIFFTGQFFGSIPAGNDTLVSNGSNSDFHVVSFHYQASELPVDVLTSEWAVQGESSTRTDEGKAIVQDAAGNLYVTGYFREFIIIGDDTLNSIGNNRRDIFVAKYDQDGAPIWAKTYPGVPSQDDRGRGIAVATDGSIYITGEIRGDVNFSSIFIDHADGTNRNGYLAKLDNNGTPIWVNQIESVGGDDRAYGVQIGPDGNIYVSGQCGNNALFAAGSTPVVTTGGVEGFVAQYSPSGAINWVATGGGSGGDRFFEVVFDANGDIWTAGFASAATTFTYGSFNLTPIGDGDIIVARLNNSGIFTWAKNFGGTSLDEGGTLTLGPNGLLYVGGFYTDAVTIGTKSYTSVGGRDALVFALNTADGTVASSAAFGSTGNENVYSLRGTDNDLFVGGYFGLNGAAPGAPITLGGVTLPGSIGGDGGAFLTQHDKNFNIVSVIGFQGQGGVLADGDSDDVQSLAVNATTERVYMTGQYFGTVGIGDETLSVPSGSSNSDFYVASLRYAPAEENTAFIQVIHNSPDPAVTTVDVYLNGDILLDNFAFRTATPFVGVDATNLITIAVAPSSSTSVADAIAVFDSIALVKDTRYIVVANGLVSAPSPAFNLDFITPAFTTTQGAAGTFSFAVMHGAPDAPSVDVFIDENNTATINDLSYPSATPYLTVPAASYQIGVAASADSANILATYLAPLDALNNMGTNAAVVLASGFLNPANVTGSNGFGLWAALPTGGALVQLSEIRDVFVQIVHNSPDTTLRAVDVFVNGELSFDNFEFRTATPFLELKGGIPYKIGIKPANTTDSPQEFDVTFENDKNYVVTATGLWNPFAYSGVSFSDFLRLDVIEPAFQLSVPGTVSLAVQHGAPDAPTVDVVQGIPFTVGVDNLAYGETTDYISFPTGEYLLGITPANDNATVVARYFAELTPLDGSAGVVYASGFLTPGNAFADATFGLWVALPAGGELVPLTPVGRADVQYVHNSPDPAAASVDVYMNGELVADNFNFRTASPYLEELANYPNRIAIAPPSSTSAADALLTFEDVLFEDNKRYVLSVNGVLDPAAFTGVPNTAEIQAVVVEPALTSAPAGQFSFAVVHGSPDAPAVDVVLDGTTTPLIDNLAFSEVNPFITVPAAEYILNITPANDNATILASFRAPLNALPVSAATVFASGFLSSVNQTGTTNAFGLWAAIPAGGALIPLVQVGVSTTDLLGAANVKAWPNPTNDAFVVQYELPESGLLTFSLINVFGAELQRVEYTNAVTGPQVERFDVSQLPAGLYFLRMQTTQANGLIRMVVQR
jgi:Domain of unknown function (DUF4397)/Secretion system C-terminal sorting domain/Beta-propeller repeat